MNETQKLIAGRDGVAVEKTGYTDASGTARLISTERFGGGSAFLRHQAIRALGQLSADQTFDQLVTLARRVVEHDSIRRAALGALPEELRIDVARQLLEDR